MDNQHTQPLGNSTPVSSAEQLRQLYDEPSLLSQQKFMTMLDEHCQAMIRLAPFVCIATRTKDGTLDISPRGDPPGAIQVLDPTHLLIPDRRGNNRLDTLTNLTHDAEIAVFFLVPGVLESLRVCGQAEVIHDDVRLESCAINGHVPATGIIIQVRPVCLQCGKALKRSALWEDTYRVDRDQLASFGNMLSDQTDTGQTAEQLDNSIDDAYRNRLY